MKQRSIVVLNVRTDVVVQPFRDRTLVLVTQMGKIGTMIEATVPPTVDLHAHVSDPHPAIQLTPVFGSAASAHMRTLYSLYAAKIATLVWLTGGGEPRGVVVGIALAKGDGERDEQEQQTFGAVMDSLREMLSD